MLPADLKARVEAAAKDGRRSLSQEIVAALEEKFPAPKSQALLAAELMQTVVRLLQRSSDPSDPILQRAIDDWAESMPGVAFELRRTDDGYLEIVFKSGTSDD